MNITDLIILAVLLFCMAAYIPVFMALFFAALVGFLFFTGISVQFLAQTLFRSLDNFALVVVLFFVLCGNIMNRGSTVQKLTNFADALVSWLPGGLGMTGVIACGLFGAISGSTVATVIAIGGFMIPALIKNGYDKKYAVGLMASSPNLGVIIPPSISMILYSMISNVSLEGLFLTGFLPGVLITLLVCIYSFFLYKGKEMKGAKKINLLKSFKDGFFAFMLPIIIFGGIFSGMFTANEAAVVACVYALFIELFIHKSMKIRDVKKVMVDSAEMSAVLLLIVAGATCFGRYLIFENVPGRIADIILSTIHSPFVFLLSVNILLLFIGMFMDIISATLILGPVFLPMLTVFNIDPMHFGLIMTINLAIGYCTPPMGVSLFITGAIVEKDIVYVSKSVFPFLLIQILVLLFLTYNPKIALFLPRLMGFF